VLDSDYADTLRQFEHLLGNPECEGPLSYKAARERDERESYPREAIERLGKFGANLLQIPAALGGRQKSLEQLLAASYAVGRRDPAVDLSFGLQMWSQLAWLAGSAEQQRAVCSLLEQNVGICLAASERAHGADLLSSECMAERNEQGYLVSGEKWPIGCATECKLAFVLAKTRGGRAARSLSWFMLGPEELSDPACQRLEKVPTMGMRASDVSGFCFSRLPVSHDRLIGDTGAGLELSLLLFQLTRPLVASLSFGPGDTAVRVASQFAIERNLYNGSAAALPTVRRSLVLAWVDFTIAEIVGVATARAAHLNPEDLSVSSVICKMIVPRFIRQAIEESAKVLGARFFMRDYRDGVFGKMYRDQSVIAILDGSTEVCTQTLAAWLPLLLRRADCKGEEELAHLCDLRQAVPALSYGRLELSPRSPGLFSDALERLVEEHDGEEASDSAARAIARYAAAHTRCLEEKLRATRGDSAHSRSTEMADLAEEYARLQSLALCVAFSVSNRGLGLIVERTSWLWLAAQRLSSRSLCGEPAAALIDDLFESLQSRVNRNQLLSSFHSDGGADE
jgi:alkylation response protein AidB-like acyl-CoA dehydrogenase